MDDGPNYSKLEQLVARNQELKALVKKEIEKSQALRDDLEEQQRKIIGLRGFDVFRSNDGK